MQIRFGDCVFDSDTREVARDGRVLRLAPKAYKLLDILIRERPKAVSREALHQQLWPATFVSDANLANLVADLRAALGDDARQPRIIRTLPRFGYAFRADTETASPRPVSENGRPIFWSADGRSLYVVGALARPRRVDRLDVVTGKRELWKELEPYDPDGAATSIRVTPDGRYYAYTYRSDESDLYLVEGLR